VYQYGNWKQDECQKEIEKKKPYDIHGMFMNQEIHQRNEFSVMDNNIFNRTKQGESRLMDEVWTFDEDSKCYFISVNKYATIKDDILSIYQNDSLIETLYRIEKQCEPKPLHGPTFSNIEEYKLVHVHYSEYKEFEKILYSQKHCARYNDWNMPIGPNSDEFMAKGAFAIHPKHNSYFFIQPNTLSSILLNFRKIVKEEIKVEQLKKMVFSGCM